MSEEKKVKIQFAPGCFDSWEGTQEELDEFLTELTRQIESGEFFENADIEDIDLNEFELDIDDIEIDNNPKSRKLH